MKTDIFDVIIGWCCYYKALSQQGVLTTVGELMKKCAAGRFATCG
jgi:hypothetical protein